MTTNLKTQTDKWVKAIEKELSKKSSMYEGWRKMECKFYPHSFNGRKVCFGIGTSSPSHEMVAQLIVEDEMENFMNHLKKKIIPLYTMNSFNLADFHF